MQQSGRAGRDLLYQGMPLMHVDKEMKEYVKHKDCRRKFLLQHFEIEQLHQPNPKTLVLRQLLCNLQVWS